jgi:carbon starvation protein CstA
MSDHQQNSTEGDANCNCALQLRLHASNLPRFGLLKALPSAFVTVTSISNSSQNNQSQSSLNNNSNNKKDNTQGNKTVEWGETEMYVLFFISCLLVMVKSTRNPNPMGK